MMLAALVEAPAGLGHSLARWLQARTGCCRTTAYRYSAMRSGVLPAPMRERLIAQARDKRAAELAEGRCVNEIPKAVTDTLRVAEEEAGYAAVAAA